MLHHLTKRERIALLVIGILLLTSYLVPAVNILDFAKMAEEERWIDEAVPGYKDGYVVITIVYSLLLLFPCFFSPEDLVSRDIESIFNPADPVHPV